MKKFVLGCSIVVVLLAIVGGGAAYYFVYRPLRSMAAGVMQFKEVPDIERRVQNKAPFTPPANGELTQADVDRFMKVQEQLHTRLGARVDELDKKYKALDKANGGHPSVTEALGAFGDLGSLIVEAKRAQVDALNANRFSLEQYDWTRKAIYAAAGAPMSFDFSQVVKKAASGQTPDSNAMQAAAFGDVPEHNKELVAPHLEKLRERAGLAFFGL
jgi:hypothetical protein